MQPSQDPIPYSDSKESEARLLAILQAASDLSSGSEELTSKITDWISFYHLSPQRCDLLRPFTELLRGKVLEVGAGCGALTRFLGEHAASVIAVEGSGRRAEIAAARCAGLPSVSIYSDDFFEFQHPSRFDFIACIGVIEYSNRFSQTPGGFDRMLQRMRGFLSAGGYLLIAIENRLGLKYFAGAPEEHLGRPFAGIDDQYDATSPVTLGREAWHAALARNNLSAVSFFYPFPDYKQPSVILSDAAFAEPELNVSTLLRNHPARTQDSDYERLFSEQMAWPAIVRNNLAQSLANSFLILARRDDAAGLPWIPPALVYKYSSDRRRGYSKVVSIGKTEGGLSVRQERMYPDAPTDPRFEHVVKDEKFLQGTPLVDELYPILNRQGWTLSAVAEWARPWIRLLQSSGTAAAENGGNREDTLPPQFIDCVPFNIMRLPNGSLAPFDLEYVSQDPLPLDYVVFRGLWGCLSHAQTCLPPEREKDLGLANLAFAIMSELQLEVAPSRRGDIVKREASFRSAILGISANRCEHILWQSSLTVRAHDRQKRELGLQGTFEAQAFWREPGQTFSETASGRMKGRATLQEQTLQIPISPLDSPHCEIRLDVADRPGVVRLFRIRLLDSDGTICWEWDPANEDLNRATHSAMRFLRICDGKQGVIVHLYSNDPFVLLPIPPESLKVLRSGGTLEIKLAWLDVMQHLESLSSDLLFTGEVPDRGDPAFQKLSRELARAHKLIEERTRQLDMALDALETRQKLIDTQQRTVSEYAKALAHAEQLVAEREAEIQKLTEAFAVAERLAGERGEALAEHAGALAHAQTLVADREAEIQKLTEAFTVAERLAGERGEALAQAQRLVAEHEVKLQALAEEYTASQRLIAERETRLRELETSFAEAEALVAEHERRSRALKEELHGWEGIAGGYRDRIAYLENQLQVLKQTLSWRAAAPLRLIEKILRTNTRHD